MRVEQMHPWEHVLVATIWYRLRKEDVLWKFTPVCQDVRQESVPLPAKVWLFADIVYIRETFGNFPNIVLAFVVHNHTEMYANQPFRGGHDIKPSRNVVKIFIISREHDIQIPFTRAQGLLVWIGHGGAVLSVVVAAPIATLET